MIKTKYSMALALFLLSLVLIISGCQSGGTAQSGQVQYMTSPWAGCGVGSYVQYKIPLAGGDFAEEKQTIIDSRPNQVTIEIFGKVDDYWEPKRRVVLPLRVVGSPSSEKPKEEILTIGGRAIKCKIEMKKTANPQDAAKQITLRTWTSDEVPGQIVRMCYDDKVALEVIEFEKISINNDKLDKKQ